MRAVIPQLREPVIPDVEVTDGGSERSQRFGVREVFQFVGCQREDPDGSAGFEDAPEIEWRLQYFIQLSQIWDPVIFYSWKTQCIFI